MASYAFSSDNPQASQSSSSNPFRTKPSGARIFAPSSFTPVASTDDFTTTSVRAGSQGMFSGHSAQLSTASTISNESLTTPLTQMQYSPHNSSVSTLWVAPEQSVSDKYTLSPSSIADLANSLEPEYDDFLDFPDPKRDRRNDRGGSIFTYRGLINLGCMALLITAVLVVFIAYPVLEAVLRRPKPTFGAFNMGFANGSGQVPEMIGNFGLVDKDTPSSAMTSTSMNDGSTWNLVWSDEFNTDGRSFYPGDDPYWEAVDLHYWATNNLEWYDPRQLSTANGSLVVTLDKFPNHDLDYMGGMMSTWNKFCFTSGYIETSVKLPGDPRVAGLWPAVWALGNLGRAGYGGTLEGLWPYSYDACDVGTAPNQTINGDPLIATTSGPVGPPGNGALSFLTGQRLSRCVCPNDPTHPGPKHPDGSWVGRSAPEIDIFEAQVNPTLLVGDVSQSAQWAPFNPEYAWINTSANLNINDQTLSYLNTYQGGVYQQATSVVSETDQNCFEHGATPSFCIYGFEYKAGFDGYITWVSNNKQTWTLQAAGMGANGPAQISARPIPQEPMYILVNLGLSENFGVIDLEGLEPLWPVHMYVDYIRVYQQTLNIGCDPAEFPTSSYIERYANGYSNPNITTWDEMTNSAPLPINNLTGTC